MGVDLDRINAEIVTALNTPSSPTQSSITQRFIRLIDNATPGIIEAGANWYDDALETIISIKGKVALEVAVGVVAATSPRLHWSRNLRVSSLILQYNNERPQGLMRRSYQAARKVLTDGPDTLTGPKVKAFYAALMGDREAVVVDVWMMRAAGFEHDAPTARQRRMIENSCKRVSERTGLSPRTVQAAIWIIMRNGREG